MEDSGHELEDTARDTGSSSPDGESDIRDATDTETVDATDVEDGSSEPPSQMDCESDGFACRLGEVTPSVAMRTQELMEWVQSRMEAGDDPAVIAEDLLDESDVAYAGHDREYLVGFAVKEGFPAAVYDGSKATGGIENAEPTGFNELVVGRETNREPPSRPKKALVLSPFFFEGEYGVNEPEKSIVSALKSIPAYREGEVKHLRNHSLDTPAGEQVRLSAFESWDEYDLIVYNGHGGEFSAKPWYVPFRRVSSFLTTGVEVESCADLGDEAFRSELALDWGVGCIGVKVDAQKENGDWVHEYRDYLTIWPNFWDINYPNGLERSVVVLNTCVSFVTEILPSKIAGSSSVVFGWDDYVTDAGASYLLDILDLMAQGLPTGAAFDSVCGADGCVDDPCKRADNETECKASNLARPVADLERKRGGDDLRIRDVVTLLHPVTGQELDQGDNLPVHGIPGDGMDDEIPVLILLDGVEEQNKDQFSVDVEVPGYQILGSIDFSSAEDVIEAGDYGYRLRGKVPLGRDASQAEVIGLEAHAELPEGGESKHVNSKSSDYQNSLEVVLANPELSFASTITQVRNGTEIVFRSELQLETETGETSVPLRLTSIDDQVTHFGDGSPPNFGGGGEWIYLDYISNEGDDQCQVDINLVDSQATVQTLTFQNDQASATDFGLPQAFDLQIDPPTEELTYTCPNLLPQVVPTNNWFYSFQSLHRNSYQAQGGYFSLGNWQSSTDRSVYGELHFDRVESQSGTEYEEDTKLIVRSGDN